MSSDRASEGGDGRGQIRVASDRDNAEASSIIKECGRRGDVRTCWKVVVVVLLRHAPRNYGSLQVWNYLISTGQCLSNWRSRSGGEGRRKASMDVGRGFESQRGYLSELGVLTVVIKIVIGYALGRHLPSQ